MNIEVGKIIEINNEKFIICNEKLYKYKSIENENIKPQIFNYPNGDKFEGNVINGKKEGRGYYHFKNGDKFEGAFKNDFAMDRGIYYRSTGECSLCDLTKNDKIAITNSLFTFLSENERKIMIENIEKISELKTEKIFNYPNGDKFEGNVINGKKEGKGIFYYNNGDKYEGEFKNDLKEGSGTYYFKDGASYRGNYISNKCPNGVEFIDKEGKIFKI
jgi:hypothetical protein